MTVTAVVGANWGDEGKGKIIDNLSKKADMVIRYQGGQNAGHTIINDYGKFVMHLLPSGVFYPNVTNILGPGVALDIRALLSELDSLIKNGISEPEILISERSQVVMPFHIFLDKYEEERLGNEKFGSTQKGIAPFFSDKYMKLGLQVNELFDRDHLLKRINRSIDNKNILLKFLYLKDGINANDLADELIELSRGIEPFVCDTTAVLHRAIEDNKNILLEGQLGALRDPDHGIYPFSTSSSTLAGFASVGAGIPPQEIERIIAVIKAYSTCVGAGPFVTEIHGDEAENLRNRGGAEGEFGATTGRARRVGWFDAVATRYGCRIQGATEAALTMMDVPGYLDEIPICIAYEIDGEKIDYFPTFIKLSRAKPVYETLRGWKCDISDVRDFDALPKEAKDYIKRIEELIQVPIRFISVGPHRDEIIDR